MAGAIADTGLGLGGIAQLIATAAPLIFGSGPKKGSGTTSSTTAGTNTSTTTPTNDPALLAILKSLVDKSLANAEDPTQTANLVTDIIRKAQVAFTPVLGSAARSGLYNSSTVQQLADESVSNATNAASQAVLNYKQNQQQLAQQGAATLINATAGKTTTGTTTGTTNGTTTETVTQAPGVPSNVSSLLGLGMVGISAYSNRAKLLDKLGLTDLMGGLPGGGSQASQDALIGGTVPPDFISFEDATSAAPSFTSMSGSTGLPIFGNEGVLGATPFTTGAADIGNIPIVGISNTVADSSSGGLDVAELLGGLPDNVGEAVSGVGDFFGGIGSGIVDAGEDVWDVISGLFSF